MVIPGSYLSLPALLSTSSVPHLQMCGQAWKHAFLLLQTRKELVCTNYRLDYFPHSFCFYILTLGGLHYKLASNFRVSPSINCSY